MARSKAANAMDEDVAGGAVGVASAATANGRGLSRRDENGADRGARIRRSSRRDRGGDVAGGATACAAAPGPKAGDLAVHMAEESDRLMLGTEYEDEAMFKHDALALLTAKETKEWMKETFVNGRSIFSRWLLPEAGLNDSISVNGKITTNYRGRPPGNLPRLMSLDEFGNKNLMDCVNSHISATDKLDRGPDVATDPKFEFCDTVRASRALLRCWDPKLGPTGGAPSGAMICAGHHRIWGKHLGDIRAAKGTMVGARTGHRRGEEPQPRGGPRERGPAPYEGEGKWLNDDARAAQVAKFERCEAATAGENC